MQNWDSPMLHGRLQQRMVSQAVCKGHQEISLTYHPLRRYLIVVLGFCTLLIFILRFVVFTFRESPKFLLSKGHDAHAIDVLYSISHFNGRPIPFLSLDDFEALEFEDSQQQTQSSTAPLNGDYEPVHQKKDAKDVVVGGLQTMFGHLLGLFRDPKYSYLFIVLAIA